MIRQKTRSVHDTIPEMDLGVATEQRWQRRKKNLILGSIS